MLRSFNGVLDFPRVREISPLSTFSAEVSPMWLYVMIFSMLMATLCAQTFVSVGVCSRSGIALKSLVKCQRKNIGDSYSALHLFMYRELCD